MACLMKSVTHVYAYLFRLRHQICGWHHLCRRIPSGQRANQQGQYGADDSFTLLVMYMAIRLSMLQYQLQMNVLYLAICIYRKYRWHWYKSKSTLYIEPLAECWLDLRAMYVHITRLCCNSVTFIDNAMHRLFVSWYTLHKKNWDHWTTYQFHEFLQCVRAPVYFSVHRKRLHCHMWEINNIRNSNPEPQHILERNNYFHSQIAISVLYYTD